MVCTILFLLNVTSQSFADVFSGIDKKVIKRAWLDSKAGYVAARAVSTRDQLVSYEEAIERRRIFKSYLDYLRTGNNAEEWVNED